MYSPPEKVNRVPHMDMDTISKLWIMKILTWQKMGQKSWQIITNIV